MSNKIYIFFALLICTIILSVILFNTATDTAVATSSNTIKSKPTIVIDPGHGGADGGASTNSNIQEKDINLLISKKLRLLFQSNGFNVIMTRETDTDISDSNASNSKQSDLKNRVNIFNSSPNNIVISIHQNKFSQAEYNGTQIFYSANNDKSKQLAQNIKQSVVFLLQPNNTRECKETKSQIFILDNTKVPAILIECGFLSNPQEAKKLSDETYQNELAFSIYLGFLEFYNTKLLI